MEGKISFKTRAYLITVLILSFLISSSAWAGYITVDWAKFNISTYDLFGTGAPSYTLVDPTTGVYASAGMVDDSDDANDWTTPISATAMEMGTVADAQANSNIMTTSITCGNTDGYSDAYRDAEIHVTGSGLILFTLPYHVEIYDDAHINLSMYGAMNNTYFESYKYFYGPVDESDSISLALLVNDGDQILFSTFLSADYHPVPIPPTALLLVGGLAALGMINRNRK